MTGAAADIARVRLLSPARRFIVFVAAIAFVLQSYITQTHIHDGMPGLGGGVKTTAEQLSAHGKIPADHRSADCPFCQVIIHSGVFVAPVAKAIQLPLVWIETAMLAFTARADSKSATPDWQSRAPPRF
jgi:hypothetical protein